MMTIAFLLVAAASNVTIEPMPDNHFRVGTTINRSDPEDYARAMLRLRAAAEEQCRGHGAPVSDGALQLDHIAGRPGRLSLAEAYACRP